METAAQAIVERQPSAAGLGQAAHNGQTKPGSAGVTAAGGFQAGEGFENLREIVRVHAGSAVGGDTIASSSERLTPTFGLACPPGAAFSAAASFA